jgi:hypothetical protein
MIDKLSSYLIVAECCAVKLRSVNNEQWATLYDQLQVAFMNDPMKYASTVPGLNDAEGMKEFWRKCEAMCLSSTPCTTEE